MNRVIIVFIVFAAISCNILQKKESKQEWRTLFNGENLDGWVPKIQHHETGDNYANTFRVVDGKIQVNYDDYGSFDDRFGHLFFDECFSSYHLKFEYRFTAQWQEDAPWYTFRNSGVMIHSQAPETILKEQNWPISIEYQILAEEEEGTPRPTANMCSPGTEVDFEGEIAPQHCLNSSANTYKWDEWCQGEIIVYSDSLIIHIVNADTVLQYSNPRIGDKVNRIAIADPAIKIDGKPLTEGYIALQSEGHGIEFKNIKIKEL
ncbi:DUF1080 domain-containing protein [uncultured Draconibacterium sp.]|uniref:3-keto-disaccharide hydrolase n=1 Tax=uncultured Draconibacterium sp. TaxID=1573823 RepID=UPI0025DD231A|nr:DUF1080 domain-containing protein [uncultured Draconibacterium sp.]